MRGRDRTCFWLMFLLTIPGVSGADLERGVVAYEQGDYTTAYLEFHRAAETGDAEAQLKLAEMYYHGRGVPRSDTQAVRWARLAAEQGYQWAQYGLGVSYARGLGVPKSLVQAYLWLNLAAAQGNELAADKRDRIEREMTREQVAEAQRLSIEALE